MYRKKGRRWAVGRNCLSWCVRFSDVESQRVLYQKFCQADGKPVVFRTLDVGGDKTLPYWSPRTEENPAMGWRAIRISLDRPTVLRQQLRALVKGRAGAISR